MGAKSEALAKQFETKAQEAAAILEKLSDADWKKVTEAEKWTVGVTAHHLASVLEPIAEWNPFSALTQATRELFGNPSPFPTGSFPSEHPIWLSVTWTVALLLVFAPLAVSRYRAIDR